MKRYSETWWIVLVVSSVVLGAFWLWVLVSTTGWETSIIIPLALLLILLGDFVIAISMEATAPTKVDIGPGEKIQKGKSPSDHAKVTSGFKNTRTGKVSIRGETWDAILAPNESKMPAVGSPLKVVGREGLTLIVAAIGDKH